MLLDPGNLILDTIEPPDDGLHSHNQLCDRYLEADKLSACCWPVRWILLGGAIVARVPLPLMPESVMAGETLTCLDRRTAG